MKSNVVLVTIASAICAFVIAAPARAYVTPRIGGGQTVGYPMIMPEIYFDGQSILVFDENAQQFSMFDWHSASMPVLRPLIPPDAFDPCMPWGVLGYKPYNYQYGWDAGLWDETSHPLPPNSGVWVKVLDQTFGLETYYKDNGYIPLFGTKDKNGVPSPDIWYWNKGMRHNAYAVPVDLYGKVDATYKVYLGNIATGAELVNGSGVPIYGSGTVTFRWLRPCPYALVGDINWDCAVDILDMQLLAEQWLNTCASPAWCDDADINQTGSVNLADFAKLANNWLVDCLATPLDTACMPR